MTLKADDGTILEAKEGTIIDSDGLSVGPSADSGPRVKSFTFTASRPTPLVLVSAVIAIPLVIAAGLAFFGVIAAIFAALLILSWVSRLLRSL